MSISRSVALALCLVGAACSDPPAGSGTLPDASPDRTDSSPEVQVDADAVGVETMSDAVDNAPDTPGQAADSGASEATDGTGGDDDASDAGVAGDAGDTSAPDDGPGGDASSPDRNPGCGAFDDGVYGAKVPWTGFEYEEVSYTCNECRGGDPVVQGSWRLVDTGTELPFDTTPDVYAERLVIDGNTWQQHSEGPDLDVFTQADFAGWYFCSDQPETTHKRTVFIVDTASPDGAFGFPAGSVWSADVLTNGPDKMLLWPYDGINGSSFGTALYCRIGSTPACSDPFP